MSPHTPQHPWRRLLLLVALAAVVFCAALSIGSSGIGVRAALGALFGSGDEATRNVLLAVRLPRVLAAFGVGSLLALCGVLLQALFRNSLADPYVLGVSGGAAVGALLAMIAGAAALVVQSAAVTGAPPALRVRVRVRPSSISARCRSTALKMEKIAVLAPIPRARVSTATSVKAGLLRRMRML